MNISRKRWASLAKSSVRFYANKMPYKAKTFNHVFQLPDYFGAMIGKKTVVSIADLGAGMFSTTGSVWPYATIHLYPSDILAGEYNTLLKENKIRPVIPVEFEDMEQLSYPDNFIDIVHCVNALDHCYDPRRAVQEMNRVCVPDGWVYLRHFANNGELQNYKGIHFWNISATVDNDCRIWCADDEFLLSEYLDQVSVTLDNGIAPEIICKARKKCTTSQS